MLNGMMNASSTLVATVSINYEDFTEGFLTCGTCLYAYDQAEHSPKLLSCSHTICHSCLERIADSPALNNCEPGCIKCPICRQIIAIPDGGISALPPSFLVNQLFDLVNRKPREFIPKCSIHISQELLFCETCDTVFCSSCTNDSGPNKHIKDQTSLSGSISASSTSSTSSSSSTNSRIVNNNKKTTASDPLSATRAVTNTTNTHSKTRTKIKNTKASRVCTSVKSASQAASAPAATLPVVAVHSRVNEQKAENSSSDGPMSLESSSSSSCSLAEHTVVPFSLAIKRMTEILQYRSQQCLGKLREAQENVQCEIEKLESNSVQAIKDIDRSFDAIKTIVDRRRKELISETKKLRENKRNVLQEQLKIIENEKCKLANACGNPNGPPADVSGLGAKYCSPLDEVKRLSGKISNLVERNDTAQQLFAPRENCFISFKHEHNRAIDSISEAVKKFGAISTSKTYPPYCTAEIVKCTTWMKSLCTVKSIDYNGMRQKFGGDPISACLRYLHVETNTWEQYETQIVDNRDGTYEVHFTPPQPGKYQLIVNVFNRPIKDSPLEFECGAHLNPICKFGSLGSNEFEHFNQPVCLAISRLAGGRLYVLDSFNSRIKVLGQNDCLGENAFVVLDHIVSLSNLGRSSTGLALITSINSNVCTTTQQQIRVNDDPKSCENVCATKVLDYSEKTENEKIDVITNTTATTENLLVSNWRERVIMEISTETGDVIRRYSCNDLEQPTQISVNQTKDIIVVDGKRIFIFDSQTGRVLTRITEYIYEGQTSVFKRNKIRSRISRIIQQKQSPKTIYSNEQNQLTPTKCLTNQVQDQCHDDDEMRGFTEKSQKLKIAKFLRKSATLSNSNSLSLSPSQISKENIVKEKGATLKVDSTGNQSKFLFKSATLQRGSKAMFSAASRLRYSFNLSSSTSAVSLQSMFNHGGNNKDNSIQKEKIFNKNILRKSETISNHQCVVPPQAIIALTESTCIINGVVEEENFSIGNSDTNDLEIENDDSMNENCEPIESIGAIAVGPNDELIVADGGKIRILTSPLYRVVREINVDDGHVQQTATTKTTRTSVGILTGTYSALCYDPELDLLLCTRTERGKSAYIQVIDYNKGLLKFNIDSFDDKLQRPSSIAVYNNHVVVADLGANVIKKYRYH